MYGKSNNITKQIMKKEPCHILHTNVFIQLHFRLWHAWTLNFVYNIQQNIGRFIFIPPTEYIKLNNLQRSAIVLHLEELNRLKTTAWQQHQQQQTKQKTCNPRSKSNNVWPIEGGEKQMSFELKYLFRLFAKVLHDVNCFALESICWLKWDFLAYVTKSFRCYQNWNCQ